jgi:hypothetical protein
LRKQINKRIGAALDILASKALDPLLDRHAKNIDRRMQEIARDETIQYIAEHMPGVKAYRSRKALLAEALGVVTIKEGLYCEFGVYRAESINFIAERVSSQIYGFDSFEGLAENWRHTVRKGEFALPSLPKVRPNVRLVKGWFNETLPGFLAQHKEPLAFLHVDSDLYSSAVTVLTAMRDRIRPGTVIQFDEYFNYPDWRKGEFKAFSEFCSVSGAKYEYIGYVNDGEQVAVKVTG